MREDVLGDEFHGWVTQVCGDAAEHLTHHDDKRRACADRRRE